MCNVCYRPQLATRLLAHKIQSPQEWEAMQALLVSSEPNQHLSFRMVAPFLKNPYLFVCFTAPTQGSGDVHEELWEKVSQRGGQVPVS